MRDKEWEQFEVDLNEPLIAFSDSPSPAAVDLCG